MKNLKSLVLVFLFSVSKTVFSQSEQAEFKTKIIPPSPDAAALGKYGEIPVGYYTGTPNIEIPLFTVEGKQLSLPVSLTYHASGIKVEEIASWVGLGWTLNAGGVVTRTVKGIKDEASNGYMNLTDADLASIATCTSDINQEVADGNLDAEPDVFYYNINGLSGKFFFDNHGNVLFENPSFHKIIPTISGEDIASWKLVSDDGTVYEFDAVEVSRSRVTQPELEPYEFSNSSWYVTKIISPNGLDYMNFEYQSFPINLDYTLSEQHFSTTNPVGGYCSSDGSVLPCPSYGPVRSQIANFIQGKMLTRIVSAKSDISFSAEFPREDIPGNALSAIFIKNTSGDTLRSFSFQHDHFSSDRLKLRSVQEFGHLNTANASSKPPFEFFYEEGMNLPVRTSFAQDHWGFYNGQTSNTTLIPEVLLKIGGTYQTLIGANRSPSMDHAKANILMKIKYPTGGTTDFEYEGNTYSWEPITGIVNDTLVESATVGVDAVSIGPACEVMTFTSVDTSFVLFNNQIIKIYGSIKKCEDAAGSNEPRIWITDEAGVLEKEYVAGHVDTVRQIDEYIELPAGTHYLHARVRYGGDRASAGIQYNKQVEPDQGGVLHIRNGEGIRVRKITSTFGNGMPALVKEFSYNDSDSTSSGVIVSKPLYQHYQDNQKQKDCQDMNGPVPVNYMCNYFVRSSHNQFPLSGSGSHIGYKKVGVKTSGNGKETFAYTTAIDYPDEGDTSYPFISRTRRDWARGKLVRHEILSEGGILLERNTNKYAFNTLSYITAHRVRRVNPLDLAFKTFQCKQYSLLVAQVRLDSVKKEQFYNGAKLSTLTSYVYDSINQVLPKIITTSNSKGDVLVKTYRYPFEYNVISGLSAPEKDALIRLRDINAISAPVELIDRRNSIILSKERHDFSIVPIMNAAYPAVAEAVVKVDKKMAFGNGAYTLEESFRNYDNDGNPREYESRKGVPAAIIWNRKGQAIGYVESSGSSDVAYAGFEEDESSGQWEFILNPSSDAKTGNRSHVISGNSLARNNLDPSKKYIVSFWAKNGTPVLSNSTAHNDAPVAESDGWRYFEKLVSETTSIVLSGSGSTLVDEVRLYLLGAKMVTCSITEGVGINCTSDENNAITIFRYDEFGRLKNVVDKDRNLVKSIEYNYKGQQ